MCKKKKESCVGRRTPACSAITREKKGVEVLVPACGAGVAACGAGMWKPVKSVLDN
ncbi:hypothetical protein A2U01_0088983 [Trifolium medium]|uniref:Uncharacterized protein n=1 Tax=Trifolium medium TaxID=97028 RepID=A0A392U4S9_9FABA|nr:hypothetical protein [Trifolium medium]